MRGGLDGPFTHWYPNGGLESHGTYVEDGGTSVPDGVWAFWYPDGTRKLVGRYDHARPVGCFAIWDEQGNQVTGIVQGDQVRIDRCDPPMDDVARVEKRSHPTSDADRWGDVSLHGLVQGGDFGASNSTQTNPDPAARGTIDGSLRKYLGRFRIGPTLGMRLSDSSDERAYKAGVVAAIGAPLSDRFGVEAEAQLAIQYLEIGARRMDVPGVGNVDFWAPLGGLRGTVSFAVAPKLLLVGGLSLDGSVERSAERQVQYCAPFCSPPITETWRIGGVAYGVDLGVRLLIR